MLDIKVEGYREAVGIFRQLSEQMQKKLLRQALRKSSRPIVQGAKSRAPKRTGLLRKSIRMISLRKDRVPTIVPMAVAPVFDVSKTGKVNAFYGRFVHDGTKTRYPRAVTRKKARGSGGSRVLVFTGARGDKVFARSARGLSPNPFMLNAFNAASDMTVDVFGRELAASVEGFVNRNFTKR